MMCKWMLMMVIEIIAVNTLFAATPSIGSADEYRFISNIPYEDKIIGLVMGSSPAYRVFRYEDLAFLSEAQLERLGWCCYCMRYDDPIYWPLPQDVSKKLGLPLKRPLYGGKYNINTFGQYSFNGPVDSTIALKDEATFFEVNTSYSNIVMQSLIKFPTPYVIDLSWTDKMPTTNNTCAHYEAIKALESTSAMDEAPNELFDGQKKYVTEKEFERTGRSKYYISTNGMERIFTNLPDIVSVRIETNTMFAHFWTPKRQEGNHYFREGTKKIISIWQRDIYSTEEQGKKQWQTASKRGPNETLYDKPYEAEPILPDGIILSGLAGYGLWKQYWLEFVGQGSLPLVCNQALVVIHVMNWERLVEEEWQNGSQIQRITSTNEEFLVSKKVAAFITVDESDNIVFRLNGSFKDVFKDVYSDGWYEGEVEVQEPVVPLESDLPSFPPETSQFQLFENSKSLTKGMRISFYEIYFLVGRESFLATF